eukprot:403340752
MNTLPTVLREHTQILKKLYSLDLLIVLCDDHEGQTATFFCTKCSILLCNYCKLEQISHRGHSLVDLKPSDFKTYSQNVISLFDEYSVENMKSKLINQSMNEIQLKASQFKQMIEKINRMLNHVASDEELQKIDFAYFLRDPLYSPQNKQPQRSNMMEEQKTHHNQDSENFQQMINKSQSKLREELKQALNAFEIKQNNQVNRQINDSIKHNNSRLDKCEKTLEEFKIRIEIVSNRCQAFENALESTNSKLSSIELICQLQKDLNDDYNKKHQLLQNQLDDTIKNLSEFIQSVKIDIDKHDTQLVDQLYLVDQEISKDPSSLLQNSIPDYFTKQYNLLYKGSRDGFTASTFHKLCDDKGPTVSFILSEYGQVFGGFTSIPWTSADQPQSDPSAFVFSLRYTYETPNGYKHYSNEAQSYLAGQFNFKVLEIEVYSRT